MAKRAIVRVGDRTSHGGEVTEGFDHLTIYGKKAAGVGHHGFCPLCKRPFEIIGGAKSFTYFGQHVALHGMLTSCGAELIASQNEATVDDSEGDGGEVMSTTAHALANSRHPTESEVIEHWYTLEDEAGSPVEGYCYDLYRGQERVAHKGSFNAGKTAAIPGDESSYVMWLERDSAKRDVVPE